MKKIKQFFKYLKCFLLSKYGFVTIFLVFAVWIVFLDGNSKKNQLKLSNENAQLLREIENNKKIIAEKQLQIDALSSDPDFIEEYAREKYQMKTPEEDVFLFDE